MSPFLPACAVAGLVAYRAIRQVEIQRAACRREWAQTHGALETWPLRLRYWRDQGWIVAVGLATAGFLASYVYLAGVHEGWWPRAGVVKAARAAER